jgi:IS30 family transposase
VALDEQILKEAKEAREALLEVERQQQHAKVDYHHTIRRLHAAGGSLREIAEALGLSHQRVHQIVRSRRVRPT